MTRDRITEIGIKNLRTIEELRLQLGSLTVLIGRNGVGKSSIIEACEILRRAAGKEFYSEVIGIHGGVPYSLLRRGAHALVLTVRVEGLQDAQPLEYEFVLSRQADFAVIDHETLDIVESRTDDGGRKMIIARTPTDARFVTRDGDERQVRVSSNELVLSSPQAAPPHEAINRVRSALKGIDVQLPFEVLPGWAARAFGAQSRARQSVFLERAARLEPLGANVANAYYTLKNERSSEHWRTTLDYVRLGLDAMVDDVQVRTGPEAGRIALFLKLKNEDQELPLSVLSDGELAYLSFVALFRIGTERSLLAFDEPDLHLHPGLLARVVAAFETMAEQHPVILATQSDRLLDALRDPAETVRVCELDEPDQRLRLRRLDPSSLSEWLADYRGVRDLRAAASRSGAGIVSGRMPRARQSPNTQTRRHQRARHYSPAGSGRVASGARVHPRTRSVSPVLRGQGRSGLVGGCTLETRRAAG